MRAAFIFFISEQILAPVNCEIAVIKIMMIDSRTSYLQFARLDLFSISDKYPAPPMLEAVKVEIDDWRRVQRKQLTYRQTTDDGNS